jgi:transposase
MPPSRHIELTYEEDENLREVEQNPHLRNKVRLRAQVLRLSGRGSNMAQIASYTGRSPTSIARDLDRWSEEVVVVLDNAPFHTAGALREREEGWQEVGLSLYRLPAYCPHLNLIEGVWRRVKGFLMPRRFYDSVGELKEAVLAALRLLGATEIHTRFGDT